MAELKFRQVGNSVMVERHNSKDFEYVGSIDLRYSIKHFDAGDEDNGEHFTADELEQIAAKLRELNGEPNTRALDERVRELRDWLVMERKRYEHRNMFEHEQANENVIEKLNELFPAELKEKESQDG